MGSCRMEVRARSNVRDSPVERGGGTRYGHAWEKLQSLEKRQEKTLDKASRAQDVAYLTCGQGLALTLISSTSNTKAA